MTTRDFRGAAMISFAVWVCACAGSTSVDRGSTGVGKGDAGIGTGGRSNADSGVEVGGQVGTGGSAISPGSGGSGTGGQDVRAAGGSLSTGSGGSTPGSGGSATGGRGSLVTGGTFSSGSGGTTGGTCTGVVMQPEQKVVEKAIDGGVVQTFLPCDYMIPPLPQGQRLDPDRLNVLLSFNAGGSTAIPRVVNLGDCPADAGAGSGWLYDNLVAPTEVFLCPATCTAVTNSLGAKVGIEYGCATVVN